MPTTSAVVIGGSLSGMYAARVLSDSVDTVTIIEHPILAAANSTSDDLEGDADAILVATQFCPEQNPL